MERLIERGYELTDEVIEAVRWMVGDITVAAIPAASSTDLLATSSQDRGERSY